MAIKRIDRQLVQKGHVVDYYVDTIDIGDGKTVEYDFLHHNGASAIIPVNEKGEILLVRQWRNALDRFTWEIPAGKLDPDEENEKCASRELTEETGYKAGKIKHLITIIPTVAYLDEKIEIYAAEDLEYIGDDPDPDEEIEIRFFPVPEIIEMIFAHKIQDSKTIAGVLAYKEASFTA